jgi:hypothetical protein
MEYCNRGVNYFVGGIAAVFVVDKIVLPLAVPTFRIHRFRPLIWAFKWLLVPCLSYSYMRTFKMDDIDARHILIADKYNFGF